MRVLVSANDPKRTYGTDASAKRIVRRLNSTTQPTRSIRTLSGMCLVAIAAYGAAMTPPNNEGFSYWRFCPLVGRR